MPIQYEPSFFGLEKGTIFAYREQILGTTKIQEHLDFRIEIETKIGTFTAEKGVRAIKVFHDGASLFKALVFIPTIKLKYDGDQYWVYPRRFQLKPTLDLDLAPQKNQKTPSTFLMRSVYDFQSKHPSYFVLNDLKIPERLAWGMITLSVAWGYYRDFKF